jgi:assimilatory nitrate reductase electron transfer subunit
MRRESAFRRRVVVVGNGMAGSRVVEEIRARDPEHRLHITVFGAEPGPAYNRVLLSTVLAGRARFEDISLASPCWYAVQDVAMHSGVPVRRIDRCRREVVGADGTVAPYDHLVLATGSRAVVPPLAGLSTADGLLAGAAVFRTLDDCHRLLAGAATARRAVVLGGGLLGLEAARGLAAHNLPVEVLHEAPHLMDRQLDRPAGRLLRRSLSDLGIRTRLSTRAVAVVGGDRVRGVELADGTVVPADLLVIACGVEPETSLAAEAGLRVERGIVVDDTLRSVSDGAVYAAGECAQHAGRVYGLVAPAWEQAAVIADRLTGADPAATYTGSRLVTRLKAAGIELAAMGESHAESDMDDDGDDDERDGDRAETVQFFDPVRGTYKKVVIRDERLVGAILLGDTSTVGTLTQLFDRGTPVPADRLALLFGRFAPERSDTPRHLPDRATVCQCNGVTKGSITACWLAGARSVAGVAAATRATTGCGGCTDVVAGIVDWLAEADPDESTVPA